MNFSHRGLDGLLPVEPGIVTAIVGPPGTGKTTLCLALAKSAEKPYLIDTEGISLERVKQVGVTAIKIARVRDFEKQHELICSLSLDCDLLIVDSLVMLYRLEVVQDHNKANSLLAKQIAHLHSLAEEKNIPVVITGHTYKTESGNKIVGGDVIKYWAKSILLVERKGFGLREATVVKHRSVPEGRKCRFRLCGTGIC
jgi:DNA repair protein RadB